MEHIAQLRITSYYIQINITLTNPVTQNFLQNFRMALTYKRRFRSMNFTLIYNVLVNAFCIYIFPTYLIIFKIRNKIKLSINNKTIQKKVFFYYTVVDSQILYRRYCLPRVAGSVRAIRGFSTLVSGSALLQVTTKLSEL